MAKEASIPSASRASGKSRAAFRTISEVALELDLPQHVLRFWESKFNVIKPMKRGGGRRYYRPEDIALLRSIRDLLYTDGYTIKGVQKLLREGAGRLADGPAQAAETAPPADAGGPMDAASLAELETIARELEDIRALLTRA